METSALIFWGWQPNFQKWLQNSRSLPQNSILTVLWCQWPQKRPFLTFENSLKSMHLFQRLMGAMNCRYIEIAKKQNVLSSEEWFEVWTLFLLSCMGFYFSLNMARRKLIKLSLLHLNLMCIEIIDHISYVSDMFY